MAEPSPDARGTARRACGKPGPRCGSSQGPGRCGRRVRAQRPPARWAALRPPTRARRRGAARRPPAPGREGAAVAPAARLPPPRKPRGFRFPSLLRLAARSPLSAPRGAVAPRAAAPAPTGRWWPCGGHATAGASPPRAGLPGRGAAGPGGSPPGPGREACPRSPPGAGRGGLRPRGAGPPAAAAGAQRCRPLTERLGPGTVLAFWREFACGQCCVAKPAPSSHYTLLYL